MNITKYMKDHEAYIKSELLKNKNRKKWSLLKEKHEQMIRYVQHERIIHLLVTLAFGTFLLLSIILFFLTGYFLANILTVLFLVLVVPYIVYYLFLENTIQGWYKLTDEIDKRINH